MCAGVHRSQKRLSDLLELELQVSYKLSNIGGAGNWTRVLCKSSKHDRPIIHLSYPIQDVFNGRLSSYCGLIMIS